MQHRHRPAGSRPEDRYCSIPASVALLDRQYDPHLDKSWAIIRCAAGGHRLFDLFEVDVVVGYGGEYDDVPISQKQYLISRACPQCKTMNERYLTANRGVPVGDDGPWKCHHCGRHLGRVDAPRGRIILNCHKSSCKQEIRLSAIDVFSRLEATERDELLLAGFPLPR